MNVLIIGSGGREHALAYKIKENISDGKLYILPGNPGTQDYGENVSASMDDSEFILSFCIQKLIDLVVIGPENPLVNGLADLLRRNKILVFGPNSLAAEIEAHKSFAKDLMAKYNIPSADYREFSSSEMFAAKEYLSIQPYPCVIKADGLASGKGVIICQDYNEALQTLEDIFVNKKFGKSGDKIIVEEFMEGEEASIFAITDGDNFICLPAAQDHKRIGDNDIGKNTGGMGAYSPAPLISAIILDKVKSKIIQPVLYAMNEMGRKFSGCLYCGLMIKDDEPRVVEFNCRFGDPETQAVLPLLKGNFLNLLYSCAKGKLDKDAISYNGGASVCVVAASGGYPEEFKTGFEITGLNNASQDAIIFHTGTKNENGRLVTSGGRVLGVTSFVKQNDLISAKEKAYQALSKINYENIYYRKDISDKAIKKLNK